MSGVLDQVKTWGKKKPQEEFRETTTEEPPEIMEIERREGMEYNEQLDVRGILYDNWLNLNRNKVTGYYNFFYWEHEDTFLDDVKNFADDMEMLKSEDDESDWPTEEFKKDIIKAEYESDEVEMGRAMKRACLRFMRRRKMGPPEKYQETDYRPDVDGIEDREFEDDDI